MSPAEPDRPSSQRLDSWKAIAEYLGRDARTAMRWHANDGLAVFAYTDEIDGWMAGHQAVARPPADPVRLEGLTPRTSDASLASGATGAAPATWGRRFRWPAAAVVLMAILVAQQAWRRTAAVPEAGPIVRASIERDAIVALDAEGRQAWRFALPPVNEALWMRHIRVSDVNGDGRPDVVASVEFLKTSGGLGESTLMAVDSSGRLLWRRTLDDHVTFDGVDYGPPWYQDAMVVYSVGGQTRITAAFHHHTWWPDIVVTFDPRGDVVGKFINAGWIDSLAVTADGTRLLAAGVNNALNGSILAVLDAAHPIGVSPPGLKTPVCANCPSGAPETYVVWPRSDLANSTQTPPTIALVLADGHVEVRANQRRSDGGPELITRLSRSLDVVSRGVSDSFRSLHGRLEREGTLAHPITACPWLVPPMKRWTPSGGWRDVE
jgi:hypothetical protein